MELRIAGSMKKIFVYIIIKLKKYLNEKKVPAHKKDKMVFLASKNEILWAPALGLSEKIKVVNRPTHVLKIINSESKGA